MNSFMVRKSFLGILLIYCCVSATLPLSNIHIESVSTGYGYTIHHDHQKSDIHILLHELLFSHFSNKSEHISNISSVQLIKHKTGVNKDYPQLAMAADTSDSAICFGRYRLTPYYDEHHIKTCLCCSVSGLSPPTA
jgi:hypothetical protein